jgi:AcrR family transcriptional regulator
MSVNAPIAAQVSDFPHGRVPRAVRERQILDLAEELFAERGFRNASMDELARRAAVSKPVIYDIMGSKEALFHRSFERAGDELARAMLEASARHAGDLAGQLHATALAFLSFVAGHARSWDVLYALDAGGLTDSHVREIRLRQARFVAGTLSELGAHGEPGRLDAVAYMLNGAYEALAHWRREHPDEPDEAAAGWLVDFALPGIERLL